MPTRRTKTVTIAQEDFPLLQEILEEVELDQYVVISRMIRWLRSIEPDARKAILSRQSDKTQEWIFRQIADGLARAGAADEPPMRLAAHPRKPKTDG